MKQELKLIKACVRDNDYRFSDMARLLGYSRPYVWQICNGYRKLSYENAILIAAMFNMHPDELFYSDFVNNEEFKKKLDEIEDNRSMLINDK